MAECIVKKSNNGEYKYPSYAQTNFHFLEFLMYTHMSWYVIYLHSLPLIDKGRYAFWMWNGDMARLMKQPGQCPAMRKTKSGTASTSKNRICSCQLLIRSRNIAKNVILAIINFFVLLYPPACFSNLISKYLYLYFLVVDTAFNIIIFSCIWLFSPVTCF